MITITIIKTDEVPTDRREWMKLADSGNEKDGGPVYGYATYRSTSTVETKLFEQTVDDLDIKKVILAINETKEDHIRELYGKP